MEPTQNRKIRRSADPKRQYSMESQQKLEKPKVSAGGGSDTARSGTGRRRSLVCYGGAIYENNFYPRRRRGAQDNLQGDYSLDLRGKGVEPSVK